VPAAPIDTLISAEHARTGDPTATEAVIFDLDGVLVWSVPMHWRAFEKTFAAEGKPFSLDDYMRLGIGASRDEVIQRVLGELPAPKLEQLMAEKEQHVRRYLQEPGIDPIPGALDFVRAVRVQSLKTAVASASRTPRLVLDSIGACPLFDAIVGRDQVARSKPYPDLFLAAAETLRVSPAHCLVIEDSAVGVDAARAAGMRVIAITTTDVEKNLARADAIYKGFAEIQERIDSALS
jgi:HAD superfamily hydrolase (TIGR01509 family)